jgi:hypothetical protein
MLLIIFYEVRLMQQLQELEELKDELEKEEYE